MLRSDLALREEILQHFWANLDINQSSLQTENGLSVEILSPGELNNLDGPDFFNAKIRIGNLVHYGAVEIHWHSKDWFNHNHHKDNNYDNVILHVVAEEIEVTPVRTSKGYQPPSLNVFHALPKRVLPFLKMHTTTSLACAGLIKSISKEVFENQLNHAQKEYLDLKVGLFFHHFNGHIIPSKAWKDAFFITLCDALGVPFNRETMKEIALKIIEKFTASDCYSVQQIDTLVSQLESEHHWKRKGLRTVTKPSSRLTQAIRLFNFIDTQSLEYFFTAELVQIWQDILFHCKLSSTNHNHRLFVSFFLPAMYALGAVLEISSLKQDVLFHWKMSKIEIPNSILKKFGIFNSIVDVKSVKKIGMIHQFNAYCKPLNCSKCAVLNKAILS